MINSQHSEHEPDRVRRHTAPEALERVDAEIEQSIRFYATQSDEAITRRIEELDREWDMERKLVTNASIVGLTTAFIGLAVNRRWLLITCTAMGFLFQHAVKGWCPPVPIFRRLGVRTRSEIDREKFALKALRGDFKHVEPIRQGDGDTPVPRVLEAINS
jgi:hypothetical protein